MTPSLGWGVLHLYYRVDRARADRDAAAAKHIVDAIAALEADGHQALCLAMLGHKADLGVIDAAKVTRSALQNAASIAALFLTTEAVVADKPEPPAGAPGGGGGGMPGGMGDMDF